MKTTYLSEREVLEIHHALVRFFATDEDPIEPSGARDPHLLGSACSRPATGSGGSDKYLTTESKAAALFHSLVMNHPFHNGNKRTALVATIVFLDENRRQLHLDVDDDAIFDFVTSVAAGEFPSANHGKGADEVVSEIAAWFGRATKPRNAAPSSMRTTDFLQKCVLAGGSHRATRDGGWLVRGPKKASIRLAGSTLQLDGGKVKQYATMLGLSGSAAGVYIDEFQQGVPDKQATMLRLRSVLRRLAKT